MPVASTEQVPPSWELHKVLELMMEPVLSLWWPQLSPTRQRRRLLSASLDVSCGGEHLSLGEP